jgi:hypothetical protein
MKLRSQLKQNPTGYDTGSNVLLGSALKNAHESAEQIVIF